MAPFLAHLPATPCCIPIPGTFAPLWNANGSSSPVTALGSDAAPADGPGRHREPLSPVLKLLLPDVLLTQG